MGEQALSLARPEAGQRIVNLCYEMVNRG
jgi:hypothetical protein